MLMTIIGKITSIFYKINSHEMKKIILLNALALLLITFTTQSCAKKQGCTNPQASNYDPDAEENNGTCIIKGCIDPTSENYNPDANQDDGSCIIKGCTDPEAVNFSTSANSDDGSCKFRKDLFIGTYIGTTECDNTLINDAIGGQDITFRIVEIPGEKSKVTVEVDFNIEILEEDPIGQIDENNVLTFQGSQKMVEVDVMGTKQVLDIYVQGTFTLDEATMDILSGTMTLRADLSANGVPLITSLCEANANRQ